MAACDGPEGVVLRHLEFVEMGFGEVRCPDGSGVV